jgi:hypothetical protein
MNGRFSHRVLVFFFLGNPFTPAFALTETGWTGSNKKWVTPVPWMKSTSCEDPDDQGFRQARMGIFMV